MLSKKVMNRFLVTPGSRVRLRAYDPEWAGGKLRALGKTELKRRARALLEESIADLAEAQERLWAHDTHSVLVILQAIDAAGKDGLIKHVMSGLNPQGCQVFSFKQPSAEELDHNFLWRYARAVPERGRIGIFNRSYYEEVLVVRVHPEWLDRQRLPDRRRGKAFWRDRYEDINAFERHLARNGTVIRKFFLHLSKDEQRKRFLKRIDDPAKQWKFSESDVKERAHWDAYMDAFEAALSATSTAWAPWYIIPADRKWVTRTVAASILADAIRRLHDGPPVLSPEQQAGLARARRHLQGE